MSVLSFQGLNNYYSYILSKVITSQLVVDGRAIKMLAETQKAGRIYATPLRFRDGARLRFEERIIIDNTGQIERPFLYLSL